MAQNQIGSIEADGIAARNRFGAGSAANSGAVFAAPGNYVSATALRARLVAINGTYFNTARMDSMTMNDLVFALRTLDDANTI